MTNADKLSMKKDPIDLPENLRLTKDQEEKPDKKPVDWSKYKGSMTAQSIEDVERELKELRDAWE